MFIGVFAEIADRFQSRDLARRYETLEQTLGRAVGAINAGVFYDALPEIRSSEERYALFLDKRNVKGFSYSIRNLASHVAGSGVHNLDAGQAMGIVKHYSLCDASFRAFCGVITNTDINFDLNDFQRDIRDYKAAQSQVLTSLIETIKPSELDNFGAALSAQVDLNPAFVSEVMAVVDGVHDPKPLDEHTPL